MVQEIGIYVKVFDQATAQLRAINSQIKQTTQITQNQAKAIQANFQLQGRHASVLKSTIQEQQVAVQSVTKEFNNFGKEGIMTSKKVSGALLGLGLSLLFAGMALKNLAESALRSIFNTMQVVSGETSEFSVLTNQLTANWEFFKFTLVDALMQTGLFQAFVGFLISVIKWFQQLSPEAKTAIVVVIVAVAALGTILMILGQVATLAFGIASSSALSFAGALGVILGWTALVIASIGLLAYIFASDMSTGEKVLWSIVTVLGAISAAAWLINGAILIWPLIIGAAIAVALLLKDEFGILFGFIIGGFLEVGDLIVEALLLPLRASLWAAGKLADLLGMDKALQGIRRMDDAINSLRNGIDSLKDANKGRIDEMIENRTPFAERFGFMDSIKDTVSGANASSPFTESPRPMGYNPPTVESPTTINQNLDINLNQRQGESTDEFIQRLIDRMSEMSSRGVQAPQRGAGQ